MPVVQVSVWSGKSEEAKKKIVEGMTEVLTDLGVPKDEVIVILNEIPKTNWPTGGNIDSEKFAER